MSEARGFYLKNSDMELKEFSAILVLSSGLVLAFIALYMPPPGEIHDSVIYIFAQILIYAGTVFGLDIYFTQKINKK